MTQHRIVCGLIGFAALLTPVNAAAAATGVPLAAADEAPATQPTTAGTVGAPVDSGSASGSSEILRCLSGQVPSCL